MHDLRTPSHQTTNTIGCHNDDTKGQEHQQMDIREEVDELTDGIVWRDFRQEFVLMNPAKGKLITGHFYPDGVYGVRRNGHDVCHDDTLVLSERD